MKILIFKEKHGERYFVSEHGQFDRVFLKMFKERNKNGWYEIRDPADKHAFKIATDEGHPKQAKAAKVFMINRCDYEYEGFESVTDEKIE